MDNPLPSRPKTNNRIMRKQITIFQFPFFQMTFHFLETSPTCTHKKWGKIKYLILNRVCKMENFSALLPWNKYFQIKFCDMIPRVTWHEQNFFLSFFSIKVFLFYCHHNGFRFCNGGCGDVKKFSEYSRKFLNVSKFQEIIWEICYKSKKFSKN